MSAPKSKSKYFKDDGGTVRVTYESNIDAAQYYIYELTRAALRDVGKYVKKVFNDSFYEHFKKITGKAKKATSVKVISGEHTTAPRVQIGLKTGRVDGFYAYFQEFGAKNGSIPKLGLLTHAAKDNIAEIIKIESHYLSGLNDEAERLESMIDEGEYNDDGEN